MNIQVIGTGSKGNSYLLTDDAGQMVLLDVGVGMRDIYRAVGDNLSALDVCLVSHLHKDHCKSAKALHDQFVDIATSEQVAKQLGLTRAHILTPKTEIDLKTVFGNWHVFPLGSIHDSEGTLGFFLTEIHSGTRIAYMTDTGYSRYNLIGLNVMIIECNFDDEIIEQNKEEMAERYNRVKHTHMGLGRLKSYLSKVDKSKLHTIVLIHLSDSNSDEKKMIQEITDLTGCRVYAAHDGDTIFLDEIPFDL